MLLDVSVCPHTETITIPVRGLTEISTKTKNSGFPLSRE